jgi:hypothetical protein
LSSFDEKNNIFILFLEDQENNQKHNLVLCRFEPYCVIGILKKDVTREGLVSDVIIRNGVVMLAYEHGEIIKISPKERTLFEINKPAQKKNFDMFFNFA